MTQFATTTDALVIGAGPTGLVMASELARRGLRCRIIDKLPEPTQTSKALAVHSRTLELFDLKGIIDETLEHGLRVSKVAIYADGERIVHIATDELHGPYPFILDLAQSETERILGQHLTQLGVEVERQVELLDFSQDEERVTAQLRHSDGTEEVVQAAWLLGCDGAHSVVRHTLNFPFAGSAYPEDFALADVKVQWSFPPNEMLMFFHKEGLFAAFPLPGGRYRLIVETAQQASGEQQPEPTLADFQRYITQRASETASVSDPAWMGAFRIHARKVEHYQEGRVFLAGDAAHIHSPAGGQGMNTGIQDAYNLAWKIALVQAGHASFAFLDSYGIERHPVAEAVLQTSDLLLRVGMIHNPLAQYLRNRIAHVLTQLEIFQQGFLGQISELAINYRKSPLVSEYVANFTGRMHLDHGPRAGDRAPEARPLQLADGSVTRLFEVLRKTNSGHTLLLLAGATPTSETWQRMTAVTTMIAERYSELVQVYCVVGDKSDLPVDKEIAGQVLVDVAGVLRKSYGGESDCLYLIRPDGYIGYRSHPIEATHLLEYLQRFFT